MNYYINDSCLNWCCVIVGLKRDKSFPGKSSY